MVCFYALALFWVNSADVAAKLCGEVTSQDSLASSSLWITISAANYGLCWTNTVTRSIMTLLIALGTAGESLQTEQNLCGPEPLASPEVPTVLQWLSFWSHRNLSCKIPVFLIKTVFNLITLLLLEIHMPLLDNMLLTADISLLANFSLHVSVCVLNGVRWC